MDYDTMVVAPFIPVNKHSNTVTAAAYMLGVTPETVLSWLANADRVRELEVELVEFKTKVKSDNEKVRELQKQIYEILYAKHD